MLKAFQAFTQFSDRRPGENQSAADSSPEVSPQPVRHKEIVLVVEDDDAMRRLVQRQLTELGYKAICASCGREALAALDDGFRIDLLFCDIVMPGGMDGVELAKQALLYRPSLKVLHTSGSTNAEKQRDTCVERLLCKPYRKATLAVAIREALDKEAVEPIRF